MLHIDFLLEEESTEAVLQILLPQILGNRASFRTIQFRGKDNLFRKLPTQLAGYNQLARSRNLRVVVLVDRDADDCVKLKQKIEEIARNAGLVTKTTAGTRRSFELVSRVAIEELEAWFFGDLTAIHAAYNVDLSANPAYQDPDNVIGGTWEALQRELQKDRSVQARLPKVKTARVIARHMNPERNRSRSFQVFRDGILEIIR